MKPAERDTLAARGRQLGTLILAGDGDAIRQASVPDLQNSFAGVQQTLAMLAADAKATVTVSSLYLFDSNATAGGVENSEQFYCGDNTAERVTLTLSGLHPGRYALVLLQLTGVADPRHLSLVLEDMTAPAPATKESWKIAGIINRPMSYGGHSGVWYWSEARKYQKNHELWNASIFYEVARQLSLPVGFLSSANAEKLEDEQRIALPADWPTPANPLVVSADGKKVEIASIHPAFRGSDIMLSLDTVASKPAALPTGVNAQTLDTPGAALTSPPSAKAPANTPPPGLTSPAEAVAASLVTRVPELKTAFSGVYIHAQNDTVTAVVPMKSL